MISTWISVILIFFILHLISQLCWQHVATNMLIDHEKDIAKILKSINQSKASSKEAN